jgi:hypothetical protein
MWHAKGLFAKGNLLKKSEAFIGIEHVQNKQSHSMIHMTKASGKRKTSNLLEKLH